MQVMMRSYKAFRNEPRGSKGFSILELLCARAIILILASVTIPNFANAMHSIRLKGAVSDFPALVQVQRMGAVDDDRYYSSYVLSSQWQQSANGFCGYFPAEH
jgi:prepilin-type N-terminal cleavage/methylation domain-containing protein